MTQTLTLRLHTRHIMTLLWAETLGLAHKSSACQ